MLKQMPSGRADRGASMMIAMGVIVAVLGFGAVAIRVATDDLSAAARMVERSRGELVAELGASEAIAEIIDGKTADFSGSGTVDGAAYTYTATVTPSGTWTVTGKAGTAPDERQVVVTLVGSTGGSGGNPANSYAVWARLITSKQSSGTIAGPIGAAAKITLGATSFGTAQHLLPGATCTGCANPVSITSHSASVLPPVSGALPCPYTKKNEVKDTTLAAGTYLCDAKKVKFKGTITVTGPVVIHLGPKTNLEIKGAQVNIGGSPDNFIIARASAQKPAKAKLENSTFVGRIIMPSARLDVKKTVTWTGLIEVDELKFDKAQIVGTASGGAQAAGGSVASNPAATGGYAFWARTIKSKGNSSGTVSSLIGASASIDFTDSSFGTAQHVLPGATCKGCSNPVVITSYTPTTLPSASGALPCPFTKKKKDLYEVKNTTLAAGTYLCDRKRFKVKGTIAVTGPVVIHLGAKTDLDIKDAQVNVGGSSDNFIIAQATTSKPKKAKLHNVSFTGQILMPSARVDMKGTVTWVGLLEVDELTLDKVNLTGSAADPGDSGTTGWQILSWIPS